MMGRVTYAWPIVILLLLSGLTLWLRQVIDVPAPSSAHRQRHEADAMVEKFTLTRLGKDGRPEARLSAQRMVHYADGETTELYMPQLEHSEAGIKLSVRSDRGVLSRDSQDAQFYDNVEMIRQDQSARDELRVNTQYLEVLIDREILRTDKPVTITQGASVLSGVGMQYDRNSGRLDLLSSVKATFQPKPRQGKS